MGKAPERKEKGKETLQSLINTKGNKNKSLEHLLQALDGRIKLKLSAFPVWVYVWRRPVWPLPMRKEKLFTFPNLGCACNWFLFVSIAEMKIQRGKKSLIWIQLNLGIFPRQNKSSTLRRAVSNRVFCFSWNVSTCSTCEESCGNAGLSSSSTTAQGRSVVLSCKLFLIWGVSAAWNKLPSPAFSFRVLDYTLLCSQALLGACVLFWMVGQRVCSVSPIDSVPTWSRTED